MTVPSRRLLILLLPLLAVGSVGWAFVTTLRPERVLAARVHGGPCADGAARSLLLALSTAQGDERKPEPRAPLHVRVTEASGASFDWQGVADAGGLVELALGRCADAAPLLEVEGARGERLARGVLEPSRERWRAAERRGGWLTGQASGELVLRVAPLEGALAVPFRSALVLEAANADGSAARGVQLRFESDGAALGNSVATTDERGRARVQLEPLEHAISLRVEARGKAGALGRWYGALPVVPGALHGVLDGRRLRVRSPIAREHAYVALVDEHARLAGMVVELTPDATGGAEGSIELTMLGAQHAAGYFSEGSDADPSPAEVNPAGTPPQLNFSEGSDADPSPAGSHPQLWAVISSEADKRSAAVVGWPLRGAGWPPRTFDALDQPLLDGLPEALAHERAARRGRRRAAALGAGLAGLLTAALFVLEVRSAERRARGLAGAAPRRSGAALGLALSCLVLGLAALIWFGTLGAP
jgi:hypothetical protein